MDWVNYIIDSNRGRGTKVYFVKKDTDAERRVFLSYSPSGVCSGYIYRKDSNVGDVADIIPGDVSRFNE